MELIDINRKDRRLIDKNECPYCGGNLSIVRGVVNCIGVNIRKCLNCKIQFETVEEWQFYGRD